MKPLVTIYYDNPTKKKNMNLKCFKTDCWREGIDCKIINNPKDWILSFKDNPCAELYIEPTKFEIPDEIKNIPQNVTGDISTLKARMEIVRNIWLLYSQKYKKE